MPYRVELQDPPDDALDRLVSLGALDVELTDGRLAALMPDGVDAASIASAFGVAGVSVSPARGRDDGSVWILRPRSIRVGRLVLQPAHMPPEAGALRLSDGPAFGTGLHPTTALSLEALEELLDLGIPPGVLDVGTGSGVLALAALLAGVPRVVGIDIDSEAVIAAAENARLNQFAGRFDLVRGGPEALSGSWPLVLANVLAAPLIELAPALVQRVQHGGRLLLSGLSNSMVPEVERAYRRLGMRRLGETARAGWSALLLCPSW
jgi:ribosomal protein L11 methyltransferase